MRAAGFWLYYVAKFAANEIKKGRMCFWGVRGANDASGRLYGEIERV